MAEKKPTKKVRVPVDIKRLVLHEAGYICSNPACRMILTLDVHHIERVADGGANTPDNLLPLCSLCHDLHHSGEIPQDSIRSWKMLLLALNEAFDRRSVDTLLSLETTGGLDGIVVSGDAVFHCSALIAAGFVQFRQYSDFNFPDQTSPSYETRVSLTDKGRKFVEGWKKGNQDLAIRQISDDKKPADR